MGGLIAKYILGKLLLVAFFLVTTSPLLLVVWLLRDQEELRSRAVWVTAPLALVCFIASWWFGTTTAHYVVDENRMFLDAVKRAYYDARLRLAFVPIIGRLFTPDEDKTHYDDDDV